MKKLIITEKHLIAQQLAKVGVFGNPTTFKKYNGSHYENDSFIIAYCQGHILERPLPREIHEEWGFSFKKVDNFDYSLPLLLSEAKLRVVKDKNIAYLAKNLQNLLNRDDIDEIIFAGDADAEGEQIVRNAVEFLGNPQKLNKIKKTRLYNSGSFDSKAVVKQTYDDRKDLHTQLYDNLFYSGLARSELDYYSGMVFCKVYSDKTQTPFRYGRVWIALLSMICYRELAIKNFVPKNYANIKVFKGKDKELSLTAFYEEERLDETGVKKKEHITQFYDDDNPNANMIKNDIEKANFTGKVIENKQYETSSRKPALFNLNDFVSAFLEKYGMTAEYAEECAEFLRFKDYTTYSRTDGNYFATQDVERVQVMYDNCLTYFKNTLDTLKKQDKQFTISKVDTSMAIFNDKKAAKQNHTPLYILRPLTDEDIHFLKQSHKSINGKMELKHLLEAYNLIATRCMIQFLPDDIVRKQNIIIEIGGHLFETSTAKTIYEGWKAFDDNAKISNGKEIVFDFNVNDTIKVDGIDIDNHTTKPPVRYTENSLRKACINVKQALIEEINAIDDEAKRKARMDNFLNKMKLFDSAKGIGTQGTLKDIFNKGIKDEVFIFEKKELHPTQLGWFVFKTVSPYLRSLELTAIMESYLIDIRSGDKNIDDFRQQFLQNVLGKLAKTEIERDIEVFKQSKNISEKQIKFAENIANILKIELPENYKNNVQVITHFINTHKEQLENTLKTIPIENYIKNNLLYFKDQVSSDIIHLLSKTELTSEERKQLKKAYEDLPIKIYSKFFDNQIEKARKNQKDLSPEIMRIIENNNPTPDEYMKVFKALSEIKYHLSEKQREVFLKTKVQLPEDVLKLINENRAYTLEEYKILKNELDAIFKNNNSNNNSKSKRTKK